MPRVSAVLLAALLACGAPPQEPAAAAERLLRAAVAGDAGVLTTLLDAGARAAAAARDGRPPIALARATGHEAIARLLLEASGVHPLPCQLPEGWTVAEPFTDQTRYWPEFARFSPVRRLDGAGTHRILLRSPLGDQSQVFLMVGETSHWRPKVVEELDDLAHSPVLRYRLGEADTPGGLTLKYVIARTGRAILDSTDVTHVVGAASMGARTLVVDAGGTSARFDPEVVLGCIRTLHLKETNA